LEISRAHAADADAGVLESAVGRCAVELILQRGERVLSRREVQSYGAGGGVNVTIMTRDAESFRQSRTQVAADIARAVSLGRRGM
jgi:hypothetical protein